VLQAQKGLELFYLGDIIKVMKTKTLKKKPGKCYHEGDEDQITEKENRKVLS
jgi:hypothetical protein